MTITINGTTGIAGVDGSASTPAFQGNDTDTGIYYPTANTVAAAAGGTPVWNASSTFAFKNRLINSGMVFDQRNNGASVTPTVIAYTLDRWQAVLTQTSKYSVQRNAGSVTPPIGFTNYLGCTSTSAYSVLTGDTFLILQSIEGFNISDFGWGAAGAQTVTLSFWVRSSLTGTFGGALANSSGGTNRSYPFSYTISAANTWEQKTVTIAGDTTGTWLTDNNAGILVRFGLGSGATYSGTAGSWQAGNFVQPTGTVSVVGTSGATFYITGVQLEKGTVATSFDWRPYGTELALCQRYYWQLAPVNATVGVYRTTTVLENAQVSLPVSMRAAPTCALPSIAGNIFVNGGATAITGVSGVSPMGLNAVIINLTSAAQPQNAAAWTGISSTLTVSAEL